MNEIELLKKNAIDKKKIPLDEMELENED